MARIAVVGSLNMDLVVRADRFPRPGETLAGEYFSAAGGKGANQAVAARRMGGQVTMVGCLGDDGFGATLRQGLSDEGVDTRHVVTVPGVATGVALITVDGSGENTIIVAAGANGVISATHVEAARVAIASARVLLLQLEVPMPAVMAAAAIAREAGTTVILNAAPARALDAALLSLADVLGVNETEVLAAAGVDAASPEDAAAHAQSRGAGAVVVTLGAAGALLRDRSGIVASVPAFEVDVVDTTAAGDAFVGAFGVALAEGAAPADALRFGSAAGALAVTRAGAQPSLPTRLQIETLLTRDR